MKKCSKCKVEKPFEEFVKEKNGKNGLRSNCKQCDKERHKKWCEENKEYYKKWREENKEKINEWYQKNKNILKEKNSEYKKKYYKENSEKINEYIKKYQKENKEKINEYNKIWCKQNKEKIKEKNKKYRQENKEKINEYKRKYQKEKNKIDSIYKFRGNVRTLIRGSFKRGTNQFRKDATTETILGCTIEEFINYIQSKFTKGMTLENHGEWHLDHIIPLASATTEEEIIKLNHYTNFQPLWAEENLSKGDRIIEQQLKLI